MYFVSSSIYQKAKTLALSEGLDALHFESHQNSKELQQGLKYIPIALLFDVYEWSAEKLEPGFCVRQGRQLNTDDYGTLGLSWKTCWLAKEVLDRVERFMMLVTDHGSVRQEELDGYTSLIMQRNTARLGIEIANEVSFVMLNGILNEVTGKPIQPSRVTFRHHSKSEQQLSDYFGCPIDFSSPVNSIQFKTSDITIRTIKADRSIHQFLVERMDEEMKGIHSNADMLIKEVHNLIKESLPSGIPSVIQVADYLGMSVRTLKRRLSEKRLTFREYVQSIQQEEATMLIKNSSQSMAEIAFQTGFSEQSAFNRAFKRWTGVSPSSYRTNG
ncbi:AraC family transcriptional regulator [Fulvivirga lutimaris]|uniref:AraC family transcriptional regulator n=1 Tax=Fulvivirga lutimaris TaxID=1819566 RepID=UPI0012BBF0DB|nr:AraC family transcriptional regulator [Fulvivirga lutimaris]MTI38058.1 AraC family transcriptional regulator [Fulvivirga lutimaris]